MHCELDACDSGAAMSKFECSSEKPFGIHLHVRNDEDCPRCGWTAPGPKSDALAAQQAQAAAHGWSVIDGGGSQLAA